MIMNLGKRLLNFIRKTSGDYNTMSISSGNICMLKDTIKLLGGFKNCFVAELGNQKILAKGKNGKEYKKCTSKEWFENNGALHASFDLNGKDGAFPLDLCEPVPAEFLSKFNLISNYGTTEHVENQEMVFKNIHDLAVPNGFMVHSIPLVGFWKGHCPFHYKENFPERLCEMNEYRLINKFIQDRNKNKLLNFVVKKMRKGDFKGIPQREILFTPNYSHNTDNLF